jgi:hypothetical protein
MAVVSEGLLVVLVLVLIELDICFKHGVSFIHEVEIFSNKLRINCHVIFLSKDFVHMTIIFVGRDQQHLHCS